MNRQEWKEPIANALENIQLNQELDKKTNY